MTRPLLLLLACLGLACVGCAGFIQGWWDRRQERKRARSVTMVNGNKIMFNDGTDLHGLGGEMWVDCDEEEPR